MKSFSEVAAIHCRKRWTTISLYNGQIIGRLDRPRHMEMVSVPYAFILTEKGIEAA